MTIENLKAHLQYLGCEVVDLRADSIGYGLTTKDADGWSETHFYSNYYELINHAIYLVK